MFMAIKQFKVLAAIIDLVPVLVMNYFIRGKGTPKLLFHHVTMLVDVFSSDSNPNISVLRDDPAALPVRVFAWRFDLHGTTA